jgi:hypothetical protein
MGGKQNDPATGKEKAVPPSTGQGADSAMDALIKGRVKPPLPAQQENPPAEQNKG